LGIDEIEVASSKKEVWNMFQEALRGCAIYEGRFEDAIKIYESILRYGYKRNRNFDIYIHHHLASLYFALRQDRKAKIHFVLKAFLKNPLGRGS